MAVVEPYHLELKRVPEEEKASEKSLNDDNDAPERLSSLNWSIAFVVNSEEPQESASVVSNSLDR